MPDEFDAQYDLDTLVRAKEIEKDAGRIARAREHAVEQKERFAGMVRDLPGMKPSGFNGATRDSKMVK